MSLRSKAAKAIEIAAGIMRHRPISYGLLKALPFMLRGFDAARDWPAREPQAESIAEPEAGRLRAFFDARTEGPGIWKWLHYFDVYERHLSRFIGREVHILEIGIYSGGSLEMWRDYFGPRAHVYGVDIEPACAAYAAERTRIFIGDQADRAFWRRVKAEAPAFDIVIDDGGHAPEQQAVTLEELLPHMRPGGVYICEDTHKELNRFSAYLYGLSAGLHTFTPRKHPNHEADCTPTALQSDIQSITLYPYLAVIEKRAAPLGELHSVKRGTQWQPFFDHGR